MQTRFYNRDFRDKLGNCSDLPSHGVATEMARAMARHIGVNALTSAFYAPYALSPETPDGPFTVSLFVIAKPPKMEAEILLADPVLEGDAVRLSVPYWTGLRPYSHSTLTHHLPDSVVNDLNNRFRRANPMH